MKVPTLTGTNFEEFGLAFTNTVRRNNVLIVIPLDYLLRIDAVGNYYAVWNSCEEKLKFYSRTIGQAFNDYAENLYTLLVKYSGTYVTVIILFLAILG